MCGICGVIGFAGQENKAGVVARMNTEMHHRGPDDDGVFVDDRITMGMRRLSIIDIDGGHQPVLNEDGSVAVVFNGEIYNFRKLRETLQGLGHRFRTHSDTEVIVHAYEQWGDDCVCHLEGMFAFAVTDSSSFSPQLTCDEIGDAGSDRRENRAANSLRKTRVLLARDRLGIKPLYYAMVDGSLIFASELRALLFSGLIEPRLSQSALRSYLLFGSVIEPATLIEGVYSLPPGHSLSIDTSSQPLRIKPKPYWQFAKSSHGHETEGDGGDSRQNAKRFLDKLDRSSAATALRSLLEEAVDSHLVADVPVGVFLSSGIDSTALVALAAQNKSAVHTVTAVFPEQEFDERKLAKATAQRFATRHQELELSGDDMLARLAEAVSALDQPSMDGVNTYFVSWAARQAGLKVALSGLGGDELFGGYSTFRTTPKAQSLAQFARHVPQALRLALAGGAENLTQRLTRSDAWQKVAALWRDPDFLPHPYFYTRLLFTPQQASALLCGNAGNGYDPWRDTLARIAAQSEKLDDFTAVSCLESQSYMANTLLRDTDCMSMAHSLEVRVPFLSDPVVEFVSGLPASLKSNNGVPKSLLVQAMGDLLPPEVVSQRKRTFTLPWEHWLRGPLKEEVAAELNNIAAPMRECLDPAAVQNVWNSFLQRKTSWSRVWSLFVLSKWCRLHMTTNAELPRADVVPYVTAGQA